MIRVPLALLFVSAALAQNGAPYDILITGGKIVDGSGNPWFRGDIAIRGDSIAAVGLIPGASAKVTLEASGLVVAPGFIDIHSHGRRGIFETPTAANYLYEGVTTLVEGPDGVPRFRSRPFSIALRKRRSPSISRAWPVKARSASK
jgi:N-acyl-D-aspartate/D-glutamate deacylase